MAHRKPKVIQDDLSPGSGSIASGQVSHFQENPPRNSILETAWQIALPHQEARRLLVESVQGEDYTATPHFAVVDFTLIGRSPDDDTNHFYFKVTHSINTSSSIHQSALFYEPRSFVSYLAAQQTQPCRHLEFLYDCANQVPCLLQHYQLPQIIYERPLILDQKDLRMAQNGDLVTWHGGFDTSVFYQSMRLFPASQPMVLRYQLNGHLKLYDFLKDNGPSRNLRMNETWQALANEVPMVSEHANSPTITADFERLSSDFFGGHGVYDGVTRHPINSSVFTATTVERWGNRIKNRLLQTPEIWILIFDFFHNNFLELAVCDRRQYHGIKVTRDQSYRRVIDFFEKAEKARPQEVHDLRVQMMVMRKELKRAATRMTSVVIARKEHQENQICKVGFPSEQVGQENKQSLAPNGPLAKFESLIELNTGNSIANIPVVKSITRSKSPNQQQLQLQLNLDNKRQRKLSIKEERDSSIGFIRGRTTSRASIIGQPSIATSDDTERSSDVPRNETAGMSAEIDASAKYMQESAGDNSTEKPITSELPDNSGTSKGPTHQQTLFELQKCVVTSSRQTATANSGKNNKKKKSHAKKTESRATGAKDFSTVGTTDILEPSPAIALTSVAKPKTVSARVDGIPVDDWDDDKPESKWEIVKYKHNSQAKERSVDSRAQAPQTTENPRGSYDQTRSQVSPRQLERAQPLWKHGLKQSDRANYSPVKTTKASTKVPSLNLKDYPPLPERTLTLVGDSMITPPTDISHISSKYGKKSPSYTTTHQPLVIPATQDIPESSVVQPVMTSEPGVVIMDSDVKDVEVQAGSSSIPEDTDERLPIASCLGGNDGNRLISTNLQKPISHITFQDSTRMIDYSITGRNLAKAANKLDLREAIAHTDPPQSLVLTQLQSLDQLHEPRSSNVKDKSLVSADDISWCNSEKPNNINDNSRNQCSSDVLNTPSDSIHRPRSKSLSDENAISTMAVSEGGHTNAAEFDYKPSTSVAAKCTQSTQPREGTKDSPMLSQNPVIHSESGILHTSNTKASTGNEASPSSYTHYQSVPYFVNHPPVQTLVHPILHNQSFPGPGFYHQPQHAILPSVPVGQPTNMIACYDFAGPFAVPQPTQSTMVQYPYMHGIEASNITGARQKAITEAADQQREHYSESKKLKHQDRSISGPSSNIEASQRELEKTMPSSKQENIQSAGHKQTAGVEKRPMPELWCEFCNDKVAVDDGWAITCLGCTAFRGIYYCDTLCLLLDAKRHAYSCATTPLIHTKDQLPAIASRLPQPIQSIQDQRWINNQAQPFGNASGSNLLRYRQRAFMMHARTGQFPNLLERWADVKYGKESRDYSHLKNTGQFNESHKRIGQYYIFRSRLTAPQGPRYNPDADVIFTVNFKPGDPRALSLRRTLNALFLVSGSNVQNYFMLGLELAEFAFRMIRDVILSYEVDDISPVVSDRAVIMSEFNLQFQEEFNFNITHQVNESDNFDFEKEWESIRSTLVSLERVNAPLLTWMHDDGLIPRRH
ncbi:hypothetical protein BP6252_03412 [Coleophoma cylindrospora]|uniref:Uncharacterized protein n=1 Tax=Coleophoma cylindrospora TaxID=1849047 RepID=A0A3D8S7W9_9HELO|nr:hypothetical protein BP6252_03412 [Coleophoma cylindrospora]